MSFWEKNKGGKGLEVRSAKKGKLHQVKEPKKNPTNKRKPIAAKQHDFVTVGGQNG